MVPGRPGSGAGPGRLRAASSLLLVIDLQSRLLPAISGAERLLDRAALLVRAAARLEVPILVTEQNPAGLGPTVAAVPAAAGEAPVGVLPKMTFDAMADQAIARRVARHARHQVVLAGAEAHVCVLQTALGLLARGYSVYLATDAAGSRDPAHVGLATGRLAAAGVVPISVEMAVFEWLERAGTESFRNLLAYLK